MTRHIRTIMATIFIALYTHGTMAATCSPGQYPDNGTCTTCPMHSACPDGDKIVRCNRNWDYAPDVTPTYTDGEGATECKPCPTGIVHRDGFVGYYADYSSGGVGIFACRAKWQVNTTHGENMFSCNYNPGTGYYDTGTTPGHCMIDIVRCDAGYVSKYPYKAASDAHRFWSDVYESGVDNHCIPAGYGKYAGADDLIAQSCPNGKSTHTDTATSPSACEPLCTAGVTKLHTDNLSYSLWNTCTSPALWIGINGNKCCANLAIGASNNALNINYNSVTYHATE